MNLKGQGSAILSILVIIALCILALWLYGCNTTHPIPTPEKKYDRYYRVMVTFHKQTLQRSLDGKVFYNIYEIITTDNTDHDVYSDIITIKEPK